MNGCDADADTGAPQLRHRRDDTALFAENRFHFGRCPLSSECGSSSSTDTGEEVNVTRNFLLAR